MSTIITKYSDYEVHSIDFFIEKINEELGYRDIPGLMNDKIEIIDVTKQHPLVGLMAAQIQSGSVNRSGLIPTISVTPGDAQNDAIVVGQGLGGGTVDDDFVTNLEGYGSATNKDRLASGLLSTNQTSVIRTAYDADPDNIYYKSQEWRKNETINISCWGNSPDIDNLLSNLIDSILAEIQVGFSGDLSPIVNFKWNVSRGLTNFNYGRVLFGTEYSLTFLNTFSNYTIYTEARISDHEGNFTYTTPGE